MKQDKVFLGFILDRSGSTGNKTTEFVSSFNSLIKKQQEAPGEAIVSVFKFDDVYETVYENVPITEVKPITKEDVEARGLTALYDSVANSVNRIGAYLNTLKEEEKPAKVIITTFTDGQENASQEISHRQLKEIISHQKDKYSWDFLFIGGDIDTDQAKDLGFSATKGSFLRAQDIKDTYDYTSCVLYSTRAAVASGAANASVEDYVVDDITQTGDNT